MNANGTRRSKKATPTWLSIVGFLALVALYVVVDQFRDRDAAPEVDRDARSEAPAPRVSDQDPDSFTTDVPRDGETARNDSTNDDSTNDNPANENPAKGDLANGTLATDKTPKERAASDRTIVRNVVIRGLDGKVVYRGDVDLTETLSRIDEGKRLRFPNDGSTFQNREGRLPKKPSGYYREFVHPTEKLDGPGPQRIVTGKSGEAFYTSDHYRTFQRIR